MSKKTTKRKPKKQKSAKPQKARRTQSAGRSGVSTKSKSSSGPVLTINSYSQFKAKVLESDKPVIVDFWAPWCGPCKMMAPTFQAAGAEHHEDILFVKVDTDDNPKIAEKFNIRALPTLMAFHNGNINNTHTGVINKRGLDKEVSRLKKLAAKESGVISEEDSDEKSPGLFKRMLGLS